MRIRKRKTDPHVCEECGKPLAGPTRRTKYCDECRIKVKRRRELVYAKKAKAPINRETNVDCLCPRCGRVHRVHMGPVRKGFVPRIYCDDCAYVRHTYASAEGCV